jgi:murein DD-endopeptidase MepM/ murein hydrolase activator NlpD
MRRAWAFGACFVAAAASAGDATPEPADVVKALAAEVEANPTDLDARVRLGEAYLVVHDLQAAERSFLAVLDKAPADAGALAGRGRVAQARGWWPDAAKLFQRAVDAGPRRDAARTWTSLVVATSRAGDADAASKAVDRALALSVESQDGPLFAAAAESACDRGDLARALAIADAGCSKFPASAWVWSVQGRLLEEQGRDKEASAAFKKMAAISDAAAKSPQRTQLSLPVRSRSKVLQAPHGKTSHHALTLRFACDFAPVDAKGAIYVNKGERNDEHPGWGADVVAAADGIVVDLRDGVSDHEPGKPESAKASGNFVYLEHAPGEVTRYWHLQKGSITVKFGDHVKRGEPIAKIGDSGASMRPMLCFASVRDRAPADESRAFVFAKYVRVRKGQELEVVDGCPEDDQIVEPAK